MRTLEEIVKDINAEAEKYSELNELQKNTSKVSFWLAIKQVVAFAVMTLETLFKEHLNDVEKIIKRTEPGTDNWYKQLALGYQDGDTITVRNNLTVYTDKDMSKRIIKRVAIQNNPEGGFKIKVAKQDSKGEYTSLSQDEKTRFKIYLSRVKFAGAIIEVVSLPADILTLNATIEIDSLIYNSNGYRIDDNTSPMTVAIGNYLRSYPFNAPFYTSKLIDIIQDIEGVRDVHITASQLNDITFTRKIDEVPAGYMKLDVENSKLSYVLA